MSSSPSAAPASSSRNVNTLTLIAVSGLRISCATPAASTPREASFFLARHQLPALGKLRAQRRNQLSVNEKTRTRTECKQAEQ
jgi:hypothetical protein